MAAPKTELPEVEPTDENTTALDEIADRVARYRKAKEVEKAGKEAAEEARADIAAHLEARGAEFGTVDGTLVIRWRAVTSERLDTRKLKDSHPELVGEFTRPQTAMRMEIVK